MFALTAPALERVPFAILRLSVTLLPALLAVEGLAPIRMLPTAPPVVLMATLARTTFAMDQDPAHIPITAFSAVLRSIHAIIRNSVPTEAALRTALCLTAPPVVLIVTPARTTFALDQDPALILASTATTATAVPMIHATPAQGVPIATTQPPAQVTATAARLISVQAVLALILIIR